MILQLNEYSILSCNAISASFEKTVHEGIQVAAIIEADPLNGVLIFLCEA